MGYLTMSNHYSFDRYEISDLNQINIIFKNKGSGIYFLKFSDGSYYVGQTVNFSQRFYQHIHGNKHHKSWHDIVAISIFNSPIELLDFHERQVIQILKHKNLKLRNKTFNFDYAGPSKLDCQIQIANRTHWINSTHPIDLIALKTQSNRLLNKTPKLLSSRIGSENLFSSGPNSVPISVAQATILSVSYIMELIPNLSQNEMAYWTITDYPETAGGRLITLNVGKLEVFYIPRKKYLFKNKSGKNLLLMQFT